MSFAREASAPRPPARFCKTSSPPIDAHVITKLREADAILIGKTNCDEFAMGSSTENSAYQITRNPWDFQRTPGGSSGGSAAAVAASFAPLSLGTDTGGSIRQPACHCGIVGLKPSYGRVSRFGLIAYGSSLDQIGPFAHDVRDAALLLEVIAGHDPRDSTCVNQPVPTYTATLEQPLKPLTIGVPREYFNEPEGSATGSGLDPEIEQAVRAALKVYEAGGATIKEISLPHSPYAVAAYYLVATAEASAAISLATTASTSAIAPPSSPASSTWSRNPAAKASARKSNAASCSAPTRCRADTSTPII